MRSNGIEFLAQSDTDPDFLSSFKTDDDVGRSDGIVDGADFVHWRESLGTSDGGDHSFGEGASDQLLAGNGGDDDGYSFGLKLPPLFTIDGLFPIEGDDGMNVLHGTDGDDIIYAHGGNDDVFGYAGVDQLYGGNGHDFLSGGIGNDYLSGGAGNDALYGDDNWTESAQDGNDVLSGGDGNDVMWGQGGNDMLIGGDGDNTYYGGTGDDLLVGSHFGDEMYGGEGADRFANIGVGVADIQVFDYNFQDDGDLVDGDSFIYYAGGNYTGVYEDGFLKFVLWDYNAEADGIGYFDYSLEPEV